MNKSFIPKDLIMEWIDEIVVDYAENRSAFSLYFNRKYSGMILFSELLHLKIGSYLEKGAEDD